MSAYIMNVEEIETIGRFVEQKRGTLLDRRGLYNWRRGRDYFLEVARKDQEDGGIRGSVFRLDREGRSAVRVGWFWITGDGRLARGHAALFGLVEEGGAEAIKARIKA